MFVKICGMSRQADLDLAAELGVGMCGFIFHPKSPRNVDPQTVAALETHGMLRVGVFVRQSAEETLDIMKKACLDIAQLHGGQSEELARTIGAERVVRVLWPERYESVDALNAAAREAEACAAYLLDAGTSGGGLGRGFARERIAGLDFPRPWMLAGGVGPGIAASLAELPEGVSPAGLDFNSALEESPACKNHGLMRSVVSELAASGIVLGAAPFFR